MRTGFDEDSNFEYELRKAFGDCDSETTLNGIKFDINGVTILVTKENTDKDKIIAEYRVGLEANEEKSRLQWEAYMKIPEYPAKRAKSLSESERIFPYIFLGGIFLEPL